MSKVSADFTDARPPGDYDEGDYTFKVVGVKDENGPSGIYLRVTLEFMEGKYAGQTNDIIVSLAPKILWRAKLFLEALGYEVPEGPFKFDTDHLLGCKFRAHCEKEQDKEKRYPPKLVVSHYLDMEEPSGSGPESPAEGAESGGEAAAPAPEAESTEPPVSRPKVKV